MSSVLSITGILMVYCYVSVVIAILVFIWSVVLWISNTLYTSKSFVLVFGCHIYLTLGSLCFKLYIGTAHYSMLRLLVFFLSTCLHVLLSLCDPGCNITSFRWTQPFGTLHLWLMLQFGHIIIVYLYHFQQLVPFYVNYTLQWQSCICF